MNAPVSELLLRGHLQAEALTVRFGGLKALDGIDIELSLASQPASSVRMALASRHCSMF
jgi:hypothetical protein